MKSKFKNMDKTLFFIMLIFTIFGLVMVFSASSMTAVLQYGYKESYFFVRQLIFVIIAYIVGFFILFGMPYKWIKLGKALYKIFAYTSIGLLIYTALFGVEINGAVSWIMVGPSQMQTSEFTKTLMILYLAFAFNNRKMFSNYKFILPFIPAVICFIIIFKQPDFGSAMIFALICFFMFLALPIKDKDYKKLKIVAGSVAVVGICIFIFGGEVLKNTSLFNEEQLSRLTYTNPCTRYSEKTGYQVCNGFIAMNNGGLFGVGLGNSTQKYLYLPEAYTDFIFPIIIEELGAIVGVVIIIGYIVLLFRILKIAKNAETLSGSLIAYGTFAFIVAHIMINLLGVLAVIPLTGVPLPFLSNGGSFNLNLIVLLFMTERVCVESKRVKLKKEIDNL